MNEKLNLKERLHFAIIFVMIFGSMSVGIIIGRFVV